MFGRVATLAKEGTSPLYVERSSMSNRREKQKPFVVPEYCKGCGSCIERAPRTASRSRTEINPLTGLIPVVLDLEVCNGCGLCIAACPEPFGLRVPEGEEAGARVDGPGRAPGTPAVRRARFPSRCRPATVPPPREPFVIKGNYASAIGALLAGCRHVFGYPITPSTEGAELIAKVLPELDGVFSRPSARSRRST